MNAGVGAQQAPGPHRHSPDTTLLSTPGPSRRWCHRYVRCRAKAWHTLLYLRPNHKSATSS